MQEQPILTKSQYAAVLKMQCPYCRYGIPDIRKNEKFVHQIPDVYQENECWANRLRGNFNVVDDPPMAEAAT